MTDLKLTWLRAVCITAMLGVTAGCAQQRTGLEGTDVEEKMNEMSEYKDKYGSIVYLGMSDADIEELSPENRGARMKYILQARKEFNSRFQMAIFSLVFGKTREQAVKQMKHNNAKCSKDVCEWTGSQPRDFYVPYNAKILWRVQFLTNVISKPENINATYDKIRMN